MSYASDTDIVFLYDHGRGVTAEALTQLAGAVNRWLTAHTVLGAAYATDFRLRPHGEGGQLVKLSARFSPVPDELRLDLGTPGAHARALAGWRS